MSHVEDKKISERQLANFPIIGKKKKNEKEEKYLREIQEYEFYNLEEPGIMHRFTYGNATNKHTFTLMHGGKYRFPRFLARHLESVSVPIWDWRPDGTGKLHKQKIGVKPRFRMSAVFS